MKDAIHGHKSIAQRHFLSPFSLLDLSFFLYFCSAFALFLLWFAWILQKLNQEVPDQLAQASWLLKAEGIHSPRRVVLIQVSCLHKFEETSLVHASQLLDWANGTLKYCKHDPFALHSQHGSGSNKQPSKYKECMDEASIFKQKH